MPAVGQALMVIQHCSGLNDCPKDMSNEHDNTYFVQLLWEWYELSVMVAWHTWVPRTVMECHTQFRTNYFLQKLPWNIHCFLYLKSLSFTCILVYYERCGNSLAVQWLRPCTSAWVWSLVGEPRSYMLCGWAKNKNKKRVYEGVYVQERERKISINPEGLLSALGNFFSLESFLHFSSFLPNSRPHIGKSVFWEFYF